jgi:hypothetical protein
VIAASPARLQNRTPSTELIDAWRLHHLNVSESAAGSEKRYLTVSSKAWTRWRRLAANHRAHVRNAQSGGTFSLARANDCVSNHCVPAQIIQTF